MPLSASPMTCMPGSRSSARITPSRTSGWSSATSTRIFMRSAPARRAAVVALASASSAVVCATALAKAGAASIMLFITFPPLSRPGKPPGTTKPSPLVSASSTKSFEPPAPVVGRVGGGVAKRGGKATAYWPASALPQCTRCSRRPPASRQRMHRRHMTQTHAPPSDARPGRRNEMDRPLRRAGRGRPLDGRRRPLKRGDVDGLGPLVAGLGVERHLRALSQRLEAVGVDAGVVDEEVLAALVRGNEAEALVVVEPLHGSDSHDFPPGLCALRTRRKLLRQRLQALNTLSSSAARST